MGEGVIGMNVVELEPGVVLGFGGTNARRGIANDGEIEQFQSVPTPTQPNEFFGWLGRQLLDSAEQGYEWTVAGAPGPVSEDGAMVGPVVNVPGLSKAQFNIRENLAAADPAVERMLSNGDHILVVKNDGPLAAHAAATKIGRFGYNRVAALILGTGVGAGIVIRDPAYANVYRDESTNPAEIGHIPLSEDPLDTFENTVSGTALGRYLNETYKKVEDLPKDHPAWKVVGTYAGRMATSLSLMNGVELVVPTGGVGAGASHKYGPHMADMLSTFAAFGNGTQRLFTPEIKLVPPSMSQIFELYGGEGVMRDFMTSQQASVPVNQQAQPAELTS